MKVNFYFGNFKIIPTKTLEVGAPHRLAHRCDKQECFQTTHAPLKTAPRVNTLRTMEFTFNWELRNKHLQDHYRSGVEY